MMETEIKKLYVYKDKPQHLPTDRGPCPFGRVCHHCCQAPLATVTKAIIKRFKVSGNTLPLASNLVKCAAAGAGLNRNIL